MGTKTIRSSYSINMLNELLYPKVEECCWSKTLLSTKKKWETEDCMKC